METVLVRPGLESDIDWLKSLVDKHKKELGFVRRGSLFESIKKGHLIIAETQEENAGFVQFHHRRDGQTTIHNIIVTNTQRGNGVGKELIRHLAAQSRALGQSRIKLKCPVNLDANSFYQSAGFTLSAQEPGKIRSLNIWQLILQESEPSRLVT